MMSTMSSVSILYSAQWPCIHPEVDFVEPKVNDHSEKQSASTR